MGMANPNYMPSHYLTISGKRFKCLLSSVHYVSEYEALTSLNGCLESSHRCQLLRCCNKVETLQKYSPQSLNKLIITRQPIKVGEQH